MKKSLSEPNCSGFYCENLDETKVSVLLAYGSLGFDLPLKYFSRFG